ncbi:type VII secretion target [Mycolicibacterium sp.]|uniref:type VII secretion target n=1 Tax=Mycolicibacterium sp. TaxID=2320850 RepID=UPI0037CA2578
MSGTYEYSPDANREWAQPHHDASNTLTESNAVTPSGLQATQGPISYAADNATTSAGESRSSAYRATAADSQQMGDLLHQAAQAYERGDVEAAQRLRARADQLDGNPSAQAAGTGTGAGGADSGGQAASQMMGQFSQMAGQMMQGVTQPVQGAMQGLSQIPQQVFQGVQGIVEAATQGAGAGAETAADAAQTSAGVDADADATEKAAGKGEGTDGADGKRDGERAPADAANARDDQRPDKQDEDEQDEDQKARATQQLGNRAETSMAPRSGEDRGPTAPTRAM